MDFTLPPQAFIVAYFEPKTLNGNEKFLILSGLLANGTNSELTLSQVRKCWPKTAMKILYNPAQYHRARTEGWVRSEGKGKFAVTDRGYEHLGSIQAHQAHGVAKVGMGLEIFTTGKTHNFDKFLRAIFASARTEVMIADSYVDETVFDNLLDQIPDSVKIDFLYGNKQGSFDARAKRFKHQFLNFTDKHHSSLHDRFIVIDDTGYIIGPSLKDAARKSPATVVGLNNADSKKLKKFFLGFWTQAK